MFSRLKHKFDTWAGKTLVLTDTKQFDFVTHYIQCAEYQSEDKDPKNRLTLIGKPLFGIDKKLPEGSYLEPIDFGTLRTTGNHRHAAFHVICPNGDEYIAFMTHQARKQQDIGLTQTTKPRPIVENGTHYLVEDPEAFNAGITSAFVKLERDIFRILSNQSIIDPKEGKVTIKKGDQLLNQRINRNGQSVFTPAYGAAMAGISIITDFHKSATIDYMGLKPVPIKSEPIERSPSGMKVRL